MRRIIRPTVCVLALCCLFLGAPIARGVRRPVTNYLFCVASEQEGQLTALYYSADFVTTGQDIRPVQDAFLAFLQQKYSFKGGPSSAQQISCTGVHSVAEAQSTERGYINRDRQDNRLKVIETGWIYPGAVTTGTASAGSAAPPTATSVGSSSTGEKSPETLRAEESQDPRLKQMSAQDRQYMLDQGAYAVGYCKNNAMLNGLYSCSCFSQKVIDARIRTNGETVRVPNALGSPVQREPFPNLIFKLDIRDCADPAKIEKYGSDREYEVIKRDTHLSRSQLDQLSACVGSSFASSFQANPVPNIGLIDRLFNSANISCHEKAREGGGPSAAAGTSTPANAARQEQGSQTQNTPSAAGTTVAVRMIDAVDSSSDPAGKQYRATVTKPVNAGNNVIIGQGSAATVTLARNGSGWVAQLTSLVINGQSVAVTSSSASVTSAAQNAVGGAANAVNSVLGGFGRRANPPRGVAAVATGARLNLPPGTSLSFVLGAIPPSNAAAQSSTKAENSSTGPFKEGYCFTPQSHPVIYVSDIFQTNIGDNGKIQDAFLEYLKQKYSYKSTDLYPAGCPLNASAAYVEENKKTLEADWRRGNIRIVETGWKYISTPNTAEVVSSPTSEQPENPSTGLFKGFCYSNPGWEPVIYVSDIFQTDIALKPSVSIRDTGPIQDAFVEYLKQKYPYKNTVGRAASCLLNASPYIEASHQRAGAELRQGNNKQIIEVEWKYVSMPNTASPSTTHRGFKHPGEH